MTREEAIYTLRGLFIPCASGGNKWGCDRNEAIDMAIEALSADTSSDLISRANAIRWVKTECNPYGKPTLEFESGKKVIEHLEQMPSTEPKMKWIPCSERLPSDGEDVIVSVLEDHGYTPWKYTTVAWLCNGVWNLDNEILFGTAVAWMPLPNPYREDGE